MLSLSLLVLTACTQFGSIDQSSPLSFEEKSLPLDRFIEGATGTLLPLPFDYKPDFAGKWKYANAYLLHQDRHPLSEMYFFDKADAKEQLLACDKNYQEILAAGETWIPCQTGENTCFATPFQDGKVIVICRPIDQEAVFDGNGNFTDQPCPPDCDWDCAPHCD